MLYKAVNERVNNSLGLHFERKWTSPIDSGRDFTPRNDLLQVKRRRSIFGVFLAFLELSEEVSWKVHETIRFRNVDVHSRRRLQKARSTLHMQNFMQIPNLKSEMGTAINFFGEFVTFVIES